MTYKDKDKQKEAQRERTRRYRAKQKGVTSEGVTHEDQKIMVKALHQLDAIPKAVIDKAIATAAVIAPTTQNTDEQEAAERKKSDKVIVDNGPSPSVNEALECVRAEAAAEVMPEQYPKDDESPLRIIGCSFDDAMLNLPPQPTRPTGRPSRETYYMTAHQLKTRLSLYHGLDWINSPEYAEIIYRLLTSTLDELKASGQSIPAWRQNQEAA